VNSRIRDLGDVEMRVRDAALVIEVDVDLGVPSMRVTWSIVISS